MNDAHWPACLLWRSLYPSSSQCGVLMDMSSPWRQGIFIKPIFYPRTRMGQRYIVSCWHPPYSFRWTSEFMYHVWIPSFHRSHRARSHPAHHPATLPCLSSKRGRCKDKTGRLPPAKVSWYLVDTVAFKYDGHFSSAYKNSTFTTM